MEIEWLGERDNSEEPFASLNCYVRTARHILALSASGAPSTGTFRSTASVKMNS